MKNFFLWLRNLRKYFFLKIVIWLNIICYVGEHRIFGLFAHSPISDIDDFDYFDYIDDWFFIFKLVIGLSFYLFLIELFIRYLIKNFLSKSAFKPLPMHKNKMLNTLDNIYTVFYSFSFLATIFSHTFLLSLYIIASIPILFLL